jgi:MFS family permease
MEPRWRALAILTAARTSMGVQFQSIASVSPVLVPELGLSYGDLGFLIGLYFLPGVIMALPAGSLGRRFGDTRTVAVGLVLMVTGGIVTSVADSTTVLTVGRTLSGIGAVLLNVLMTKMVTDWFAGRCPTTIILAGVLPHQGMLPAAILSFPLELIEKVRPRPHLLYRRPNDSGNPGSTPSTCLHAIA